MVEVGSLARSSARYLLYQAIHQYGFVLVDTKGSPRFGDLVAIELSRRFRLAFYHGQPILGSAIILAEYKHSKRSPQAWGLFARAQHAHP